FQGFPDDFLVVDDEDRSIRLCHFDIVGVPYTPTSSLVPLSRCRSRHSVAIDSPLRTRLQAARRGTTEVRGGTSCPVRNRFRTRVFRRAPARCRTSRTGPGPYPGPRPSS